MISNNTGGRLSGVVTATGLPIRRLAGEDRTPPKEVDDPEDANALPPIDAATMVYS